MTPAPQQPLAPSPGLRMASHMLAGAHAFLSFLMLISGVYQTLMSWVTHGRLELNSQLAAKLAYVLTGLVGLLTSSAVSVIMQMVRFWFNLALTTLSLVASVFLVLKSGLKRLDFYHTVLAATAAISLLLWLINFACLWMLHAVLKRRVRPQVSVQLASMLPLNGRQSPPRSQMYQPQYSHQSLGSFCQRLESPYLPYLPESSLISLSAPPLPRPPPLVPTLQPPPYIPNAKPPDYCV